MISRTEFTLNATAFPWTPAYSTKNTTVRTTRRIVRLTYFPPLAALNFKDELMNHRSTMAKPMETWPMGRRSAPRTKLEPRKTQKKPQNTNAIAKKPEVDGAPTGSVMDVET